MISFAFWTIRFSSMMPLVAASSATALKKKIAVKDLRTCSNENPASEVLHRTVEVESKVDCFYASL